LDTGINAVISWFFNEKHEITVAVREVTDFLNSPISLISTDKQIKFGKVTKKLPIIV
jgi:hypothetical protein